MSEKKFWLATLSGLAVVTLVMGFFANQYYLEKRIEEVSGRLLLLSNLRREALQRYLDTAEAELNFWSANRKLIVAQTYFRDRWQEVEAEGQNPEAIIRKLYRDDNPYPQGQRSKYDDAGDGSTYSLLHGLLHAMTVQFVDKRGYYDFFLIDPAGNIGYSVEKEDDYGSNLLTGPWKDTGLADVFRRALAAADQGEVVFSNMEHYGPSAGAPALFMARAMHEDDGSLLGVIAFQLPTDRIVQIMNFDAGMGRTGETYLVGDDLLMRSNSRFSEVSTILEARVDTATVRRALQGEYGVAFTRDYRGVDVLSAYSSAEIDQHTWAVMAEVDRAEILESAAGNRPMLTGLMLFFYGLGVGSIWLVRRPEDAAPMGMLADLDGGVDLGDA